MLSLWRCQQSGQARRKTYRPGETQTHKHAFFGHWLYRAISLYWTSRISWHMLELKVFSSHQLLSTTSIFFLHLINFFNLLLFQVMQRWVMRDGMLCWRSARDVTLSTDSTYVIFKRLIIKSPVRIAWTCCYVYLKDKKMRNFAYLPDRS